MLRSKAPLQQEIVVPRALSPYDRLILELAQEKGGFLNAHAHLDRGDTVDDEYLEHINTTSWDASFQPLSVKQNLTGDHHRGLAYTEEDLRQRVSRLLEREIAYGITAVATCIDVTPDLPKDGMLAWRVMQELKAEFADRIKLYLGPNPIFGFKEGTERWEVFVKAAGTADFLSCLPEKDAYSDPAKRDGKIGYREHLRRVMALGCSLHKEVHLHLDQTNTPQEKGTLTLIEALRWIDQPKIAGQTEPTVWVIHAISPSCYSEKGFAEVVDGLLEHNIGVIVCPTAAISMRQYRTDLTPTHNCIARVLELLKAKVRVLIGTDNICDVFVPQSDGDILTELKMLGHAVRCATPHIMAKLGAGEPLNDVDRATIGQALYQEYKAYRARDPNWEPAVS